MGDRDKALLEKRRNASIKNILAWREKHIDPHVPEEVAFQFRKVIFEQVNSLADLAIDLVDTEVVMSEEFIKALDDVLHDFLDRFEDEFESDEV